MNIQEMMEALRKQRLPPQGADPETLRMMMSQSQNVPQEAPRLQPQPDLARMGINTPPPASMPDLAQRIKQPFQPQQQPDQLRQGPLGAGYVGNALMDRVKGAGDWLKENVSPPQPSAYGPPVQETEDTELYQKRENQEPMVQGMRDLLGLVRVFSPDNIAKGSQANLDHYFRSLEGTQPSIFNEEKPQFGMERLLGVFPDFGPAAAGGVASKFVGPVGDVVLGANVGRRAKAPKTVTEMGRTPKGEATNTPSLESILSEQTHGSVAKGNQTVKTSELRTGIEEYAGDADTQVFERVRNLADEINSPGGYIERVVVDDAGNVLEGRHRVEALKHLGIEDTPIVRVGSDDAARRTLMQKFKTPPANVGGRVKGKIDPEFYEILKASKGRVAAPLKTGDISGRGTPYQGALEEALQNNRASTMQLNLYDSLLERGDDLSPTIATQTSANEARVLKESVLSAPLNEMPLYRGGAPGDKTTGFVSLTANKDVAKEFANKYKAQGYKNNEIFEYPPGTVRVVDAKNPSEQEFLTYRQRKPDTLLKRVLEGRHDEMQTKDLSKRTQPDAENIFDLSDTSYGIGNIPRPGTPPVPRNAPGKTFPQQDRVRGIIDNEDALAERISKAVRPHQGSELQHFYAMGPVVTKARQLGVPEEKIQDFMDDFANHYGATSPKTATEENLRNATLAMAKKHLGFGFDVVGPGSVPTKGGAAINESGYPMMLNDAQPGVAKGLHKSLLERIQSGKNIDPLVNPKPATFAENIKGNFEGVTVDTHAIRNAVLELNDMLPGTLNPAWIKAKHKDAYTKDPSSLKAGWIDDSLKTQMVDGVKTRTEYGPFSDLYKNVGKRLGVTPAEAQSLAWFVGGKRTNLASQPKSLARLIGERISVTAKKLKMPEAEVLKKLLSKEMPLMGLGAGAMLGAPKQD